MINTKATTTVIDRTMKKGFSVSTQCYLLISLQIIGFFVFTLYPFLWTISKSVYFYDGIAAHTSYIGFDNFKAIFTNGGAYWGTWLVTFKFAIMKICMEIPLAMILAVLLSKAIKGTGFFRGMYYLPNIISVAITAVVFSNMFDYFGIFNNILMTLGMIKEPIDWFGSQISSLGALAVTSTWQTFGINVLYICAALNNVPKDVYEAADIDGAGKITQFFKITLPLIMPVFVTIMLLSLNGTLHTAEFVVIMSGGAPAGSTYTVGAYLLSKFVPGFADGAVNVGYGCALSIITSIIYIAIALVYTKSTNKLKNVY